MENSENANIKEELEAIKEYFANRSEFSEFIRLYLSFTKQLINDKETIRKIESAVNSNDSFGVYESAELNDYMFALSQVIKGLELQLQNEGIVPIRGYFTMAFNVFLKQAFAKCEA